MDTEVTAAKTVLRKNKKFIKDNLTQLDDHLDNSEAEGYLTVSEIQTIKSERTEQRKISTFVEILSKKGPNAYHCFVGALRADNQFMAERLENHFQVEMDHLKRTCHGNSTTSDSDSQQSSLEQPEITKTEEKSTSTDDLDHQPLNFLGVTACRRYSNSSSKSTQHQSQINSMFSSISVHMSKIHGLNMSNSSLESQSLDKLQDSLNDLLKEIDSCYTLLDTGGHVPFKSQISKLKESLKEMTSLKNKYADIIQKLETKCRDQDYTMCKLKTEKQNLNDRLKKSVCDIATDTADDNTCNDLQVNSLLEETDKLETQAQTPDGRPDYVSNDSETSIAGKIQKTISEDDSSLREELEKCKQENEQLKAKIKQLVGTTETSEHKKSDENGHCGNVHFGFCSQDIKADTGKECLPVKSEHHDKSAHKTDSKLYTDAACDTLSHLKLQDPPESQPSQQQATKSGAEPLVPPKQDQSTKKLFASNQEKLFASSPMIKQEDKNFQSSATESKTQTISTNKWRGKVNNNSLQSTRRNPSDRAPSTFPWKQGRKQKPLFGSYNNYPHMQAGAEVGNSFFTSRLAGIAMTSQNRSRPKGRSMYYPNV